jgi:hypothetical protein
VLRLLSALLALCAGGLIVINAFAFAPRVGAWICFGIAIVVLAVTLGVFAIPGGASMARTLELLLVSVAAWSILAARVFGGALLVRWLSFADGCGIAAIGLLLTLLAAARLGRLASAAGQPHRQSAGSNGREHRAWSGRVAGASGRCRSAGG